MIYYQRLMQLSERHLLADETENRNIDGRDGDSSDSVRRKNMDYVQMTLDDWRK